MTAADASSASDSVVIIGAGWAGVTAGIELVRHGVPVTLLESAKLPGGRARRVETPEATLDNGQHLLIGAYSETLRMLRTLGIEEDEVLTRLPLMFEMRSPKGRNISLHAPRIPAPLHLLVALLGARGLTAREKWRAIRTLPALMRWDHEIDMSVSDLLATFHQPAVLRDNLWVPLCIAALNVGPEQASAQVFTRVLRDSFTTTRAASDLLIPKRDLGALLPEPGCRHIEQHGGKVVLQSRVQAIRSTQADGYQIETNETAYTARDVVLATGPVAAERLAMEFPRLKLALQRVTALGEEPITTVYLQYDAGTTLERPMIGLNGTVAQWVFDRRTVGQPGLMAVVISASGTHMELAPEALAASVQAELAALFPQLGEPQWHQVIREKRATFRCSPGSNLLRPTCRTEQPGVWLAGDYTRTGLPGTLEGAVRSGLECAHAILKRRNIEIKAC